MRDPTNSSRGQRPSRPPTIPSDSGRSHSTNSSLGQRPSARGLLPLLLALAACACAGGAPGEAQEQTGETLLIEGARILPMVGDTVLTDHAVMVRDGRIDAVAPLAALTVPAGTPTLDARGRWLLPGLIDFHVHLRAESELASYLRHGVTTVVSMRGSPELLEARERLRAGAADATPAPRIFTSGPLLDGDPPIWSGDDTRVLRTASDAREAVREHVATGYDLVKVYNNLDPALLEVVVEEAHGAGLAVVGHLPRRPVRREGLRRALEAGLDVIAHGEEVFFTRFGGAPDSLLGAGRWAPPTDAEVREVAREIAAAGAAVVPTLSFIAMTAALLEDEEAVFADPAFQRLDPGVREMWREQSPTQRRDLEAFARREAVKGPLVRRLTAALAAEGVPLFVGTDASAPGLFPGASAHVELRELVGAGLSSYEALVAATRAPGAFLADRVPGAPRLGVISPGAAADLILVEGDPLADLRALERPSAVMVRGRWVAPPR